MIIVKDDALFAKPNYFNELGGAIWRANQRIKQLEELERRKIPVQERRNITIGEVAEEAAKLAMVASGYTVLPRSWYEFNYAECEGMVDMFAWDSSSKRISIQVKGSEHGNRALRRHMLDKYIKAEINVMMYVAVRQVGELVGSDGCHFECDVTWVGPPSLIKTSWELRHDSYVHPDNNSFIKKWERNDASME